MLNMRALEDITELTLTGAAAYTANGRVAASFDNVQPVAGLLTSIRGLAFEITSVFLHDNVGSLNLPEEFPFRLLEQVKLKSAKSSHQYIDLTEQAGWALYCLMWAENGRKPQRHGGGGNIAVAAATSVTVRAALYVPFQVVGGVEPDDFNIPLSELIGSQLEVKWADAGLGGIYDAGADNVRISSASIRIFADLIGRDEAFRRSPKWTIKGMEFPAANDNLPLSEEELHWLLEIPLQAAGITANRITAAERTTFKAELEGQTTVDNVDVSVLSRQWSRVHARTGDDELAHHETDASPFLPLVMPRRRPFKRTHCPEVHQKPPRLTFGGSDVTPYLVFRTADYIPGDSEFVREVRQSKVRLPAGFNDDPLSHISVKTDSKSETNNPAVRSRMPVVIKNAPAA